MATILLGDGRRVRMVSPNLWDLAEIELQTGWTQKEQARMMTTRSISGAVVIFSSLRRAAQSDPGNRDLAGITFAEVCELAAGVAEIENEPGDLARQDAEGEQGPDPLSEATSDDAGEVPTS